MTAFAAWEWSGGLGALRWELRSVNHRYLELALKLPDECRSLEPAVRDRVARAIQRGKIDVTLRWRRDGAAAHATLDPAALEAVLAAWDQVARRRPDLAAPGLRDLLAWPGIIAQPEADAQELQDQALAGLDRALEELNAARTREGDKLRAVLQERLQQVRLLQAQARELLPALRQSLRERLQNRLADLKAQVDPLRFEQELVLVLQRADVDEELERLRVHAEEIERVLARNEPVGRRLDFLVQELHREANTFGAKSQDLRSSQIAVDLKIAIEQMREQIQNLE